MVPVAFCVRASGKFHVVFDCAARYRNVNLITVNVFLFMMLMICVFVAGLLAEIHGPTSSNSWRYCPTDINPADISTQVFFPKKLKIFAPWFEGPVVLLLAESKWPKQQRGSEVAFGPNKTILLFTVRARLDFISCSYRRQKQPVW